MIRSVITATGSYIPDVIVPNSTFESSEFYECDGMKLYRSNRSIIDKFQEITGIRERRYARIEQTTSDLAYLSARAALESGVIDPETLDGIIVAHNFGDMPAESNRTSMVPSLASRVKAMLKIINPDCKAYDITFGCPGWIEGLVQADSFIRSGNGVRYLVIGAETLSRVIDPHDRDSMIYSDGAGAAILEAVNDTDRGILSHKTRTYALDNTTLLRMGGSFSAYTPRPEDRFLKMEGRKVYEFALNHVPPLIKATMDHAGVHLTDISKIIIHQANEKMDQAILKRLCQLFGKAEPPEGIMPMTISWLGNSSVATVPTLLDLILKGALPGHSIRTGEKVIMASVGAGMNINALVYKF